MANLYMKNYSPSSVNSFIEYRTRFYMEKIMGLVSPTNISMELGKAVESGITAILKNGKDCRAQALVSVGENFDINTMLIGTSEERDEARAKIEPLIDIGVEALAKYGELKSAQRRIYTTIEGISLPWVGFVDFDFGDDVIVDLKVTGKTPSSLVGSHSRQGAFYKKHTPENKKVIFMYLVPLKKQTNVVELELKDADMHYNHLMSATKVMDRLLSNSDDGLLEDVFFPNLGCFTMNDETFRKSVNDIWFNLGEKDVA